MKKNYQIIKNNDKIKKTKLTLKLNEEEVNNISLGYIYKYATRNEKLFALIGIIGSILKGCTMPIM